MSRWNTYLVYLLILSILNISCADKQQSQTTTDPFLPNIVYIFADDLGYGDLGCFGATDIKTPYLDQLAEGGIKFTEFYSASPVCSPSRAGLLTGRIPQRMGINSVFFPESFTGMSPEEITIAEMLKERGYATGIVGKWHLGHREVFLPLQQGFDSYFGIPFSNDMRSVVYMRNNEVVEDSVDQRYTTKKYAEESLKFIEANKEKPFFLYLAHNMPHVPLYVSEDYDGTSDRGLYGDVIQEIDWSVGQVLQKLGELELLENTLVIFSSDNGPWLVMEEHGGSAGILREGKQFTFEGGVRVPTLAYWKGKIPEGTVSSAPAAQVDWFPTIASITSSTLPADRAIDGKDLSPVLLGTGSRDGNEFLFFDGEELQGYRKGDFKIKLPYAGYEGSPWKKAVAAHDTLLINLKEDPGEQNNLYTTQKDKAKAMYAEMQQVYKALGELPPSLKVSSPQDGSHFDYLNTKKEGPKIESP